MSTEIHGTELLPAHSLDCLDEEDIVLVSEHLADCDACQSELRAYQAVVDDLAMAIPIHEPPTDLRTRLMDRVQPSHPPARVAPRPWRWEQLTRLLRGSVPAWGVVSLVVVAVLVVGSLWLWGGLGGRKDAGEPDVLRTIKLSGTETTPEATGLLVVSLDGEHGTLVVDGLAPLGEEQQYQLWLIQNGDRTSGGIFSVSEEGYGSLWISSPEPLSSYGAFGITIEPAGGSPGPTGDKVLGSTL
jgi:anti-sigma-K factor RskA